MNRYFYILQHDDGGNQIIHLSGNLYYNDADETETCYRIAEWTAFFLRVDKAKQMLNDNVFFDVVDEKIDYLGDVSESEAKEIIEVYFNGAAGNELHILDITKDTPCGEYWFKC